jgi:hypothetical protein
MPGSPPPPRPPDCRRGHRVVQHYARGLHRLSRQTLGVPQLGVVGEVAGEAHARLGHGPALLDCLAGRSALPLEPGHGGRLGMPQDPQPQAAQRTNSAPAGSGCRPRAGSGAELVRGRGLRLGVGHATTARPDQLHPGRGGRSRLPPRGPPAGPSQATAMTRRAGMVAP